MSQDAGHAFCRCAMTSPMSSARITGGDGGDFPPLPIVVPGTRTPRSILAGDDIYPPLSCHPPRHCKFRRHNNARLCFICNAGLLSNAVGNRRPTILAIVA